MRLLFISVLFLTNCATLVTNPIAKTTDERLQTLEQLPKWPTQKPVAIHWHKNMIPFVEAQTDADGAFAVGVVHAHLRLGQMEIFRRLSAGRLSESAGPFFVPEIDRALRTINLQRSAQMALKSLGAKEKLWLENFVAGLNFYIKNLQETPREMSFMDIEPEPWTVTDALRVGRLAGADINWGAIAQLVPLRETEEFKTLWERYSLQSRRSLNSFNRDRNLSWVGFLRQTTRSGSNSLVVSGNRTKTGKALIASDPHLGIFAPNFWLLMGYKTPTYHVLGYMVPGVPAVTVGRNAHIAFGGTYMRSVSTHLFEVDPKEKLTERTETISKRGWFSEDVVIRDSSKGPIISDIDRLKLDKPVALTWAGHAGSDELGSFLAVNRSKNWKEFRKSFQNFAVAGLNMTYADDKGNIGMVLATKQPQLKKPEEFYQLIKSVDNEVVGYKDSTRLPASFNPQRGFIASANNSPVQMEPPIAFVTRQNDRMERFNQLMDTKAKLTTQELMATQLDTYSPIADRLRNRILEYYKNSSSFSDLKNWDARYQADSRGPMVFEIQMWQLANAIFNDTISNDIIRNKVLSSDIWRQEIYEALEQAKPEQIRKWVTMADEKAQDEIEDFASWGDMHTQTIQSPLGLVPYLGRGFRYKTYGASGGATTINKAVSRPGTDDPKVIFGAQSRHISDLSDMDENYFVMLGGHDGWLDNPHLTDQVDAWRKGEYIKLPLKMSSIPKVFNLRTIKIP